MPKAIEWSDEMDRQLKELVVTRRKSYREVERIMGVSKSGICKRVETLKLYEVSSGTTAAPARGIEPLHAGHPSTMAALRDAIGGTWERLMGGDNGEAFA